MSIYYCKKTRRQFLVGSGKSLLALPLLPSLLPRNAWGQSSETPRRMMMFRFDHNQLNAMWPSPRSTTSPIGSDGAREVLLNTLGTMGSHSPALNHSTYQSLMNSNLVTMVRGLDLTHYSGHGNGAFAAARDRYSEGNFPTIDTIIERSQSVYPNSTPLSVHKALRIGIQTGGSLHYRKVGSIVEPVPYYSQDQLTNFYNEVFGSLTGGSTPPQDLTNQLKSNILNKVYESFTGFRNGSKISSNDRARIDQHMDYLSDLQRSFASVAPTITCDRPANPGTLSYDTNPALVNQTYMDLLAVAFKCGITKFGAMTLEGHDPQWIPGLGANGIGVHSIMHGDQGASMQLSVKINWWRYFSDMIAERFIAPLQELEGETGRSYIDNMATIYACSGGWANPGQDGGHNGVDTQQIIIGSMGGRIRTGRYMTMPRSQTGDEPYFGNNTPYNCFLITLLNLMGVPPSEYAFATPDGQGFGYYGGFSSNYPRRSRFYQPLSELLT